MNNCDDTTLSAILTIVKNIMTLIQIFVPILLIVFGTISFIKLVKNPEEKNGIKKIINQFLAAAIVFFVPVIVNAIMLLLGETNNISYCWNNVSGQISIGTDYIDISGKEKQKIYGNASDYEKGGSGVSMNNTNAKSIPSSVLAGAPHSNLSVVIADDNGNILAEKDPDLLREGGSTTKVFTGLAAVKLLDPTQDIIISTQYAQNMPYMGDPDVKVGQRLTVSQAATKDFPGSSNITTANIAIAIGKKYYNTSSDADAYNKGMDKINEYLMEVGCKRTKLVSSSGVNYNYGANRWGEFDGNGISKGTFGITASDLVLVTTVAMKDEYFASGIGGRNNNGLFYIKSGTQAYKHGIWGFNHKGKRYYIALLGFNFHVDGDTRGTVSKSVYNWAIKNLM